MRMYKDKYYIYNKSYVVKRELQTGNFYRLEMVEGDKQWCLVPDLINRYRDSLTDFEELLEESIEGWIEEEELDADNVYRIPPYLYEKHKNHNEIETSIKFYKVNQNDDIIVYLLFEALAKERVFFPCNDDGNLLSLVVNNMEVIPVFTRENRAGEGEPINLRPGYLRDYIDVLLKAGKHLMINPFSEENIKLLLPYGSLEKMLLPIIRSKG